LCGDIDGAVSKFDGRNRMIDLLNYNQGFAMVILTFAYVVTTIIICLVSYKQIATSKDIQRQNVKIQLFDKRHEVYQILLKWIDISQRTFELQNRNEEVVYSPKGLLTQIIYKKQIRLYGQSIPSGSRSCTTNEYVEQFQERLSKLPQDLSDDQILAKQVWENEIYHILGIRQELALEGLKIIQAQYLFEGLKPDIVENFAVTFGMASSELSEQTLESLRLAFNSINKENILQLMRQQLNLT